MEVQIEQIQNMIYVVRGQRVMLDSDLASLYGVETKALNRQVRRNIIRFPKDFMFQLTKEEYGVLKRQFGTSKTGSGGKQNIHRKWCCHALKRPSIRKSSSYKYLNYENIH